MRLNISTILQLTYLSIIIKHNINELAVILYLYLKDAYIARSSFFFLVMLIKM